MLITSKVAQLGRISVTLRAAQLGNQGLPSIRTLVRPNKRNDSRRVKYIMPYTQFAVLYIDLVRVFLIILGTKF